jgi:hypothetical protein
VFKLASLFTVVCSVLILVGTALANPSDQQPHAAIDIYNQQFAPQLLDTAQTLAEKNRASIEKFLALAKDKKHIKIDAKELGTAHVNAQRLQRAAEQLILLGEPAGVDYAMRASQQSYEVRNLARTLQLMPEAAQGIAKLRTSASQAGQLAQKQIPKIEKLVERKDWDAAAQEMYDAFDQMEVYAVYMDDDAHISLYQPWLQLQAKIQQELTASRKEAASKLFAERIAATKTDLGKLLADVQAATAGLKTAPQYTLDGKMQSGPELIAHFDTAWQKAQVATIKTLALEWALANNGSPIPTQSWSALRAEHDKFAASMGPALCGLIAADAARVDAAAAPALYQAYLPVVADLADHTGGALESELQAALETLIAKSPALATNVQAYRAVTDDLLRWRGRIAGEQAATEQKTTADATAVAKKAFERGTDSRGLVEVEATSLEKATLNEPAGQTLTVASPKLVGQVVSLKDIYSLGGKSRAGIARFHKRLYGRVTIPNAALDTEVAALEAQLMVADQQPPLSLQATRAVRSARRGDLVQTGGKIVGVFLEAQVTRFATLPDAAAMLLPLGKLPEDHTSTDQLAQVIVRIDLQLAWVHHRYLFVKLPQ